MIDDENQHDNSTNDDTSIQVNKDNEEIFHKNKNQILYVMVDTNELEDTHQHVQLLPQK